MDKIISGNTAALKMSAELLTPVLPMLVSVCVCVCALVCVRVRACVCVFSIEVVYIIVNLALYT